jgi:putative ATP-dependent endonuclease of OLD family
VFVGSNNVGKTTVIEALALLFGRDRLVRVLTEHDFFESAPDHSSRITIAATLTGFEADDSTAHREWFGVEARRGEAAGRSGRPLCRSDPAWKLAVQFGLSARFNLDTLEGETLRFFVDDDTDIGDPTKCHQLSPPRNTPAPVLAGSPGGTGRRTFDTNGVHGPPTG